MTVAEDPPLDSILWACTLAAGPRDGQLERHYSTYVIYFTGLWGGVSRREYDKLYRPYRIMDEFSGIAFHLICLGKFERQFQEMWFDAFQVALENWRREHTSQ